MPVTTIHQYIDQVQVQPGTTRMIVGTIHPHRHDRFHMPFFYGNVGSFWDILHNAFEQHNLVTLENIQAMLQNHNVWITDMIRQCERANETVTQDRLLTILEFNTEQIRAALLNNPIDTIFFTSRFGKNNAAKLFTQEFGINYNLTFNPNTSEFTIPVHHFGREIRCVVLYSPSNDANRGICRAIPYRNQIQHFQQFPTPIKRFKVDFYREKFQFLD